MFFGWKTPKNAACGEKILDFASVKGGGVPPLSVKFFFANFTEKSCPLRPRGGYPPNGHFPWLGFLKPSLTLQDFFAYISFISAIALWTTQVWTIIVVRLLKAARDKDRWGRWRQNSGHLLIPGQNLLFQASEKSWKQKAEIWNRKHSMQDRWVSGHLAGQTLL